MDLAIPALEAIQQPHVRREYATALVQQLLRKGDPLAQEKLNKLLDRSKCFLKFSFNLFLHLASDSIVSHVRYQQKVACCSGAVQSLIVSRIQKQIAGLVLNRDKKDAEADKIQLSLAARLLALNFPGRCCCLSTSF